MNLSNSYRSGRVAHGNSSQATRVALFRETGVETSSWDDQSYGLQTRNRDGRHKAHGDAGMSWLRVLQKNEDGEGVFENVDNKCGFSASAASYYSRHVYHLESTSQFYALLPSAIRSRLC